MPCRRGKSQTVITFNDDSSSVLEWWSGVSVSRRLPSNSRNDPPQGTGKPKTGKEAGRENTAHG